MQLLRQTNKYFLHYEQLSTFDHPSYYTIGKTVSLQPSCWLIGTFLSTNLIQLHMIMIYADALSRQGPQA